MKTLYTVERVTKADKPFGPSHGADSDQRTVCGLAIDSKWWITDNTFTGTITCKRCLKILKDKPTITERLIAREKQK